MGPEIDCELNELLIRLVEVATELHVGFGSEADLLQERADLLRRAQDRGLCLPQFGL